MDFTGLARGERAKILSVHCSAPLKERLRALGLSPGNYVHLVGISRFKRTYLVRTEGSLVAFGREVATCLILGK